MTKKQRQAHKAQQDRWLDRRRMLTPYDPARRTAAPAKKAARRQSQTSRRQGRR